MAILFGRKYTKTQLLERVGDISQLCHANRCRLVGGKRDGVEAVFFDNSSGLSFSVLPGRGMDLGQFYYKGVSLSWRSAVGETSAAFFEPSGFGMERSYHGGMMHISGINYAGLPCEDNGESLGLHGRISNTPSEDTYSEGKWNGDDYELGFKGRVREVTATGSRLELKRSIRLRLGEPVVFIDDVVTNIGYETTEHMILYHTNFGFPLLDNKTSFIIPSKKITAFNEYSAENIDSCKCSSAPDSDSQGDIFYYDLASDNNGRTEFAVINPEINNGEGIALSFEYNKDALSNLLEWKFCRRGYYVTELGPANCHVAGRAAEREAGTLKFLKPGESMEYRLKISVCEGKDNLNAVKERVNNLLL